MFFTTIYLIRKAHATYVAHENETDKNCTRQRLRIAHLIYCMVKQANSASIRNVDLTSSISSFMVTIIKLVSAKLKFY